MKTVKVQIEGISALLINRFKEQSEVVENMRGKKKDYGTARYQAEQTAYADDTNGLLWVPSSWIKGAIQSIASDYKLPSSRKSVKSVSGGAIIPTAEKLYFDEKYKLKDIEVDSRPCVIMRARIMRHRSKLENWSLSFELEIDDNILDVENVHQILSDAGRRSGLGDFRPQRGGPFGRFLVVDWKVIGGGDKAIRGAVEVAAPKKRGRPKKID